MTSPPSVRDSDQLVLVCRLGVQDQKVMGLDEAVAEFAAEAVPPDVRRAAKG